MAAGFWTVDIAPGRGFVDELHPASLTVVRLGQVHAVTVCESSRRQAGYAAQAKLLHAGQCQGLAAGRPGVVGEDLARAGVGEDVLLHQLLIAAVAIRVVLDAHFAQAVGLVKRQRETIVPAGLVVGPAASAAQPHPVTIVWIDDRFRVDRNAGFLVVTLAVAVVDSLFFDSICVVQHFAVDIGDLHQRPMPDLVPVIVTCILFGRIPVRLKNRVGSTLVNTGSGRIISEGVLRAGLVPGCPGLRGAVVFDAPEGLVCRAVVAVVPYSRQEQAAHPGDHDGGGTRVPKYHLPGSCWCRFGILIPPGCVRCSRCPATSPSPPRKPVSGQWRCPPPGCCSRARCWAAILLARAASRRETRRWLRR